MNKDHPPSDPAEIRCEMVLCLESGPAQEIKWCPLPAHDQVRPRLYRQPVKRELKTLTKVGRRTAQKTSENRHIGRNFRGRVTVYIRCP